MLNLIEVTKFIILYGDIIYWEIETFQKILLWLQKEIKGSTKLNKTAYNIERIWDILRDFMESF